MDWHSWHNHYDDASSPMALRLAEVQNQIALSLNKAPSGPLRVISVCAGQGRDLLGVLQSHFRRDDVSAILIDLEEQNTLAIQSAAQKLGLKNIRALTADASKMEHYVTMAPADLVLMCGVFGNISDKDIRRTISISRRLCGHGGRIIWTRHRRNPDMVPRICSWFHAEKFEQELSAAEDKDYGVLTHRYLGKTRPIVPDERMFDFVGYRSLREA